MCRVQLGYKVTELKIDSVSCKGEVDRSSIGTWSDIPSLDIRRTRVSLTNCVENTCWEIGVRSSTVKNDWLATAWKCDWRGTVLGNGKTGERDPIPIVTIWSLVIWNNRCFAKRTLVFHGIDTAKSDGSRCIASRSKIQTEGRSCN
jgi:hypothetical protein